MAMPSDLGDEALDHLGRDPGCAETGGDLRRRQVGRLHPLEGRDVAGEGGIERGVAPGQGELVAHRARQVAVGGLAATGLRILEHRLAEQGQGLVAAAPEQLGDPVEIDQAAFVQRDGERVGGGDDQRLRPAGAAPARGRSARAGRVSALRVVVLDRGHQPAVGVVLERVQVDPALGLAALAGDGIRPAAGRGQVDRAEGAHEGVVGDAQPGLRRPPGAIVGLGTQDLAHGVADRDQCLDDPGMPGRDALPCPAAADRDRRGSAVDDLQQPAGRAQEIAALLDRRTVGGGTGLDVDAVAVLADACRRRQGDVSGQRGQGGGECFLEPFARHVACRCRLARTALVPRACPPSTIAGWLEEVLVDP